MGKYRRAFLGASEDPLYRQPFGDYGRLVVKPRPQVKIPGLVHPRLHFPAPLHHKPTVRPRYLHDEIDHKEQVILHEKPVRLDPVKLPGPDLPGNGLVVVLIRGAFYGGEFNHAHALKTAFQLALVIPTKTPLDLFAI